MSDAKKDEKKSDASPKTDNSQHSKTSSSSQNQTDGTKTKEKKKRGKSGSISQVSSTQSQIDDTKATQKQKPDDLNASSSQNQNNGSEAITTQSQIDDINVTQKQKDDSKASNLHNRTSDTEAILQKQKDDSKVGSSQHQTDSSKTNETKKQDDSQAILQKQKDDSKVSRTQFQVDETKVTQKQKQKDDSKASNLQSQTGDTGALQQNQKDDSKARSSLQYLTDDGTKTKEKEKQNSEAILPNKTDDSQARLTPDSSQVNADNGQSSNADDELNRLNNCTFEEKQLFIRNLAEKEGWMESPIDISITKAREILLSPLEWINFNEPPKKLKITNTGLSIIMSAKWKQIRPYLQGGPLIGKYVFSNWHLHWGENPMEGSEHTIDGVKYPLEMHVVTFKSSYLTQEAALKEQDGCATLVYIFKLQDSPNPNFQNVVEALNEIRNPGTSKKIDARPITNLVKEFTEDYFFYWGAVSTKNCMHFIMWLITRIPIGASAEQIDALRCLFDIDGKKLIRNFRDVEDAQGRTLFHVCPSTFKHATMLPVEHNQSIVQVYRCLVYYDKKHKKLKTENDLKYAIKITKPQRNSKEKKSRPKKLLHK